VSASHIPRQWMAVGVVTLLAGLAPPGGPQGSTVLACWSTVEPRSFTPLSDPEMPGFVRGQLGVLQSNYRWRYKLAAWRILNGRTLSAVERRAYLPPPASEAPASPVEQWLKARNTLPLPGPAVVPQQEMRLQSKVQWVHAYVTNCGDAAFRNAAATMQDRQKRPEITNALLVEWVRAQDVVFSNCRESFGEAAAIPAALTSDAPALARADREYQRAAAHFYAGQFPDAVKAFRAIANDSTSPWRTIAPYLVARALVRQGTIGGPDGSGDPAALQQADEVLGAILRDRSRRDIHDAARGLRTFLRVKRAPTAVLHETVGDLLRPEAASRFAERLADVEYLRRRAPSPTAENEDALRAPPDVADFFDWVDHFGETTDPEAVDHILSRWDATQSDAWLVAAMTALPPDHPRVPEFLERAATVGVASPAFATTAFHQARLLIRTGNLVDARQVLDRALAQPSLPIGTTNLFKSARLLTARSLDDFMRDAVRSRVAPPPDLLAESPEVRMAKDVLDRDVIDQLNEALPLSLLRRIADRPELPHVARTDLRLAVFTRAFLLDDLSTVRALVPDLMKADPTITSAIERFPALDDDRLRDEFVVLLLRTPGLRPFVPASSFRDPWWRGPLSLRAISGLRDNWWCSMSDAPRREQFFGPFTPGRRASRFSEAQRGLHADDTRLPPLVFLSDDERSEADTEWEALTQVDTAPNELGRRGLDWARRNPDDPRVPEVLHRIVQAVRLGCTDPSSGAFAKSAFELLHSRYGKSPWAARTPYWYR